MKAALIAGGVTLTGVWAYDQIAPQFGGTSLWATIFSNSTLINYFFPELWLLVAGLALIILAVFL